MDQEPQIPGWQFLDKIGEGGRGTVYRARQISLDRLVAIKILRSDFTANAEHTATFIREAQAAAQLSHPNIVQAIEVGEYQGTWFFAMELIEGGNLQTYLQQHGVLPERNALDITVQIAQALDFAWSRAGIIHRDIKPANIVLTPDGRAKLADLGLAIRRGSQKEPLGYTEGTPQYCAPEQCRGDVNLDTRTDLYALGATLYHMLCGRAPFDGDDPAKVMTMQIMHPLEPPRLVNPNISPAVEEVVVKLLAKDPSERFQTPTELIQKIDSIRTPQQIPAPQPEPQQQVQVATAVSVVATLIPRRPLWMWLGRFALLLATLSLIGSVALAVVRPELFKDWCNRITTSQKLVASASDVVGRVARLQPLFQFISQEHLNREPVLAELFGFVRKGEKIDSSGRNAASASSNGSINALFGAFARLGAIWSHPLEPIKSARASVPVQPIAPPVNEPPPVTAPAPAPSAVVASVSVPPAAKPASAPPVPVTQPTPQSPPAASAAAPKPAITNAPVVLVAAAAPAKTLTTEASARPATSPARIAQTDTNKVSAAAQKHATSVSTSAVKRVFVRHLAAPSRPAAAEAISQRSSIALDVQRLYRKKDAADATPIQPASEGRSHYYESASLRIAVQNLSPQKLTNVTVRWAIAKTPVGRKPSVKDVFLGAQETTSLKPMETKVIETPIVEVSGETSTLIGRAWGEMIRGHGVQVLIGTNCVAEEMVPSALKLPKTLQPVPKPTSQ